MTALSHLGNVVHPNTDLSTIGSNDKEMVSLHQVQQIYIANVTYIISYYVYNLTGNGTQPFSLFPCLHNFAHNCFDSLLIPRLLCE